MATTLGGVTLEDPNYEREGYVRQAQDVGAMHEMLDGSSVYDDITTKYRFRLQWNGVTEGQRDAILLRYLEKGSQVFSPPDSDITTYTVFVVPNSWQDSYLEDDGQVRYYWCQMELVEAS